MEGSKVKALRAAEEGDKKALQEVIMEGKVGVVDVVDEDGNTPLMYAATNGREEVLRLLLDQPPQGVAAGKVGRDGDGAKYIDAQNQYGWTALMQAACYGHSDCVQLLLQRGANLQLSNSWKVSCLVIASQGGHFGVVHTLINNGAKVDPDVSEELMSCTLTPLMAAAQCGHVEVVQELVTAGAHLNVKLKATKWTALMFAILNNRVGVVELLLTSGVGLEEVDIEGRSPADMAAHLGYHRVLTLLTGGTLKNISDSEFFEAVSQGTVVKVNEMLTQKPNLANIEDKDGATPLMYASNKGHSAVCEVLLQAKAEVNTKDRKYGWTSLMHATHHRKYEVAEKLGQHGADVNIRDSSGSTAYDIASVIGDIKMIKLIANITVERLQDKTMPTASGATPTNASVTPTIPPASRPIDFSEFRSRLQHAYNIPTPKITMPAQSPNGPPNGLSRPPSTRTASTTSSSSSPSANLRPSLAAKGFPSPSKSAGPLPPTQRPPLPTSLFPNPGGPPGVTNRISFPPGTSRQNSSPFPPTGPGGRSPFSPTVPGGRGPYSPAMPGGRSPFSPATPGGRGPFSPGRGSFSPVAKIGAGKVRKRANTDPVSLPPKPSGGRGMNGGLQSVLKQASMERYFSIFLEQEVDDIKSFVSLASEDLVEMGITDDQDRMELMALMDRLRIQSTSSNASSLTNSDVFY